MGRNEVQYYAGSSRETFGGGGPNNPGTAGICFGTERSPKRSNSLSKFLVNLGYCTEEDVARVIAKRAGVPFLRLSEYPINAAAVALLAPENATLQSLTH